ncbi:MAG: hypothetical protein AAF217_12900 [Pseudomonadota bacterium]
MGDKRSRDKLTVLIEREKRAYTQETFNEVWDDLRKEDIEPAFIAEIFIHDTLRRLAEEHGNDKVSKMLSHFNELNEMGVIVSERTIQ